MYSTGRTGGTRVLLNFMNELVNLGHEVSLTTLGYDNWFPLHDVEIITKKTKLDFYYLYGIQMFRIKDPFIETIKYLKKIYNITQKSDVHIATFSTTAYVASWKSIDGSTPFYHMQHFETLFSENPLMKKFISDTYFLPIYKIANSTWLSEKLYDLTGIKYPIVNASIEHDIFYPRQHNKKNNEINIVALGKGGWKNATGIYNAVNSLRSKYKNLKIILHFYGHRPAPGIKFDGIYTTFHKDLTDEQLAILYSNSDIQVTFSKYESFPLPPLEAMASGCAVITTPYGVEDYAIDLENTIITEPDNINMLTEKLDLLIQDETLRNKLIKNGIETTKKFRYDIQVKILEENIKKALDENTKNNLRGKII